jgi:antitoxin FitA
MNPIVLDNLNPLVFDKIRSLAQRHNRSLEDEIKVILAQVAEAEIAAQNSTRANFRAQLEAARLKHGNQTFSDSVELLREDRNR